MAKVTQQNLATTLSDMEKELRAVSTPAQYGKMMKRNEGQPIRHTEYRQRVGTALYLNVISRPDISNCVRELAQHMDNPGDDQWKQLKHLISYICSTKDIGFVLRGDGDLQINGYVDSDFATDPNTHKNMHQQTTWSRQVSTCFLHRGHELWMASNKEVYSNKNNNSTMDYILNQKIDQLFSQENNINYHDRDIFHEPVEEKYNLTEKQKITWIEQTTTTLKKCKEDHQTKMRTGQKDIRQFFESRKVSL